MKKWTAAEEVTLKENFFLVKDIKDLIALLPDRDYYSIRSKANHLKLKKKRIYYKNELFFDTPNLVNSYWAGFIVTDGHVKTPTKVTGYSIVIKLQALDKEHLQKFANDANSNVKIYDTKETFIIKCNPKQELKTYYSSILIFRSANKWKDDLFRNWNIPEGNKIFVTTGPSETLSNENSLAFIAGMIDGDGTIGISHDNRYKMQSHLRINFLGTFKLLNWIKEFLIKNLNLKFSSNIRSVKNIFALNISGYNATKLFNILNSLNCPKLERKWKSEKILTKIQDWNLKHPELLEPMGENWLKQSNGINPQISQINKKTVIPIVY